MNTSVTCGDCQASPPAFRALRSWSIYAGPVREAILRLKYGREIGLGDTLAQPLAAFTAELDWPVDIVAAVPLGRVRLRERGYNQAAVIGWPLALALGRPYVSDGLSRSRETTTQVGLSRSERRQNVRGAFVAAPSRIARKNILLVDDVATTGSTVSAAAHALFASGASNVFALTVARALPEHGQENV
jgi:ComF family protein